MHRSEALDLQIIRSFEIPHRSYISKSGPWLAPCPGEPTGATRLACHLSTENCSSTQLLAAAAASHRENAAETLNIL